MSDNYTFIHAILNRAKIRTRVLWGWGNGFRVGRKYRVMVCVVKVEPEVKLSPAMLQRTTHVNVSAEDIARAQEIRERDRQ